MRKINKSILIFAILLAGMSNIYAKSSSSSGSSSSSSSDGSCPSSIGYSGYPGSGRNTQTGEGRADGYQSPNSGSSGGSSGSGSSYWRDPMAIKAESEVSVALAEISRMENEIARLKSDMSKLAGRETSLEYKALSNEAKRLASEVSVKRASVEASLAVLNSRRALFESAEVVGDPVQISSGAYIVNYVDFKAKDKVTNFQVRRKYSGSHKAESFGTGWICPFDSRIIRNRPSDVPDCMTQIDKAIECCQKAMDSASNYISKYGSSYPSASVSASYEKMKTEKENYQKLKQTIIEMAAENAKIDELNKYVSYGDYSDKSQFRGGKDQLIFVNENGDSILFHYKGNGEWVPYEESAAQKIKMYGLKSDGEKSSDYNSEGGYQLIFANGEEAFYTKYGLLIKKICSNGNETLFDCAAKKEGSVTLATGEVLTIKRNEYNYIERIEGNVSGFTEYNYSGNKLLSVRDNDGVLLRFSFDNENNLTAIIKADGKSVNLSYEYNATMKKAVCTQVNDEEGNSEYFTYNPSAGEVIHKTYDGGTEVYRYNADGVTIYQKGVDGLEKYFYPNGKGLVESVRDNGEYKYYSYDNLFRLIGVSFDDGTSSSCSYNSSGKISKITDCDGFSNSWEYDSKGNVTASFFNENQISASSYYSNGLLKNLEENSRKFHYTYNQFGYITSKSEISDGRNLEEKWEYDSRCRVVKYTDVFGVETRISYPDLFTRIEIYGNSKKIERHFNERLFEIETTEIDLKKGTTYKKNVKYDGRGKPVEIWMNGVLISEYEYMPSGKLKVYTVWNHAKSEGMKNTFETCRQGARTEYLYDSAGRLIEEKRKVVNDNTENKDLRNAVLNGEAIISSCSYQKTGNSFLVNVLKNGKRVQYIYNSRGLLTKTIFPDGFYKKYSYYPSGRLKSITDSQANLYKRTYFRDGTYTESHQNCLQNLRKQTFNQNGLLLSASDFMGNESLFKYDSYGNILQEESPSSIKKYSYDNFFRPSEYSFSDYRGKVYLDGKRIFNAEENSVTFIQGDKKNSSVYFDCWNRPVKVISAGVSYELEYDYLGNCIKRSDGKSEILYEYSPFGNFASKIVRKAGGKKEELFRLNRDFNAFGCCIREERQGKEVFSCVNDEYGRIVELSNQFGNKSFYDYDSVGHIASLYSYSGGKINFTSAEDSAGNIIYAKNEENAVYTYGLSPFFKPKWEESALKKKLYYSYDRNGRLTGKKSFSGKEQIIEHNYRELSCSIIFSDGEKFFIQKNPLGQIISIKSDFSSMEYDYDRGGRLTSVYDLKNDIKVSYSYDDFGRCISKSSRNFEFSYLYNEQGFIKEVSESMAQFWVRFDYDELNREILRRYSNGVQKKSGFNEKGQKCFCESRDSLNNLICADYIVYDDKNRVQYVCDNFLNIKQYSYDEGGRLISTCYPYNNEISEFARKEAVNCGLYLKSEHPDGNNVYFDSDGIAKIRQSMAYAGNTAGISGVQYSWIEKYEYTASGAVKSIENPYGKINYEYDASGRLLKKYASNSKEEGMSFYWNDDNCLEKVLGKNTDIRISYGAMQRPFLVSSYDKNTGKPSFVEFKYDALGRRIYERTSDGNENVFLYDGSGNNILLKTPLRVNGMTDFSGIYTAENQKSQEYPYFNYERDAVKTGIFDNQLSSFRTVKTNEGEKLNADKNEQSDFRINEEIEVSSFDDLSTCVFLNIGDSPSVLLYPDRSLEVIANDFRGNAAAVFRTNSDCTSIMEYDTWGNPLKTGKKEAFSGARGKIRSDLLFYNLSARDYCPELKCFTSMDLARDGSNWFAYCACDPVNYRDTSGFKKNSASDLENFDYTYAIMSVASDFSIFDYYSEGDSYFIPSSFDCADVSFAIDNIAAWYAGMKDYSDKAAAFNNAMEASCIAEASSSVCSSDFFGSDYQDSFRKTSDGYDRNTLRSYSEEVWETKSLSNVSAYISEMRNKAEAFRALSNPNVVSPGTVLAWKSSDTADEYGNSNWKGHTLTVVARTFDDKGYVTGFAYIEGHTGGNKTRIGYMNVASDSSIPDYNGNVYNIDSWYGNYLGTFEIESSVNTKGGGCGK